MSDTPNLDDSSESERNGESSKSISEEQGLKSAESVFKAEAGKTEDSNLDEDREFLKYLKCRKRAKDLGLDDPLFTTIYHGGIHITDSNVENNGIMSTGDSKLSTGGFSGEVGTEPFSNKENIETIESIFDKCEDIKQRSFMISLSALNGCNYRTVVQASQRLQSILQSYLQFQAEVDVEE